MQEFLMGPDRIDCAGIAVIAGGGVDAVLMRLTDMKALTP
jgi:hypothetical protein